MGRTCQNALVPDSVPHRARGVLGRLLLVVALGVQARLLYAPDAPGTAPFPQADKVVHAILFAAPTAMALLGPVAPRLVLPLLVLHAPVSEAVQAWALRGRTGDVWDAVADLAGILLTVGLWRLLGAPRAAGSRAPALVDSVLLMRSDTAPRPLRRAHLNRVHPNDAHDR